MSGPILGENGGQVLDGALAVQQPKRLASERKQHLYVRKLDISEAFDAVSHSSVVHYLARLGPNREAHLMLILVIGAKVRLSFCGVGWEQKLERGIVQGAPYSAKLFARVVDSHLGSVHMQWQRDEETWLTTYMCHLFLVLYADVLSCSRPRVNSLL